MLSITSLATAAEPLTIVVSHKEGVYKKITQIIEAEIKNNQKLNYQLNVIAASDYVPSEHFTSPLVTIGTAAAKTYYQSKPQNTSINALLTRSAHQSIIEPYNNEAAQAVASDDKLSSLPQQAIYLDQPYERYFNLGKRLTPEARSVGILLGPALSNERAMIEKIAQQHQLKAEFALISPDKNPINLIEPVMLKTDFFVVIPDQQAVNQSAARWVIQLAYRHKKPIIAYSKKYAQAGALASVYVSPEDIAEDIIKALLPPGDQQQRQSFSVFINPSVARSLRIPFVKNENIEEQLISDEAHHE